MTSGNTITWLSRVSADAFRQMGMERLDMTAEATIQRGQIQSQSKQINRYGLFTC